MTKYGIKKCKISVHKWKALSLPLQRAAISGCLKMDKNITPTFLSSLPCYTVLFKIKAICRWHRSDCWREILLAHHLVTRNIAHQLYDGNLLLLNNHALGRNGRQRGSRHKLPTHLH
jgi:hypothetical protein